MLPLYDENPTRHFPALTLALIAANVAAFLIFLEPAMSSPAFFAGYGLVPAHLTAAPAATYPQIFTSMFLHGGIAHLGGNMLYLWIFGNNIEDVLGKAKFLLFYLLCGVIAALSHYAGDMQSEVPMVGASGAVSGILGAYAVLFPRARVRTLVFLGCMIQIVRLPAAVLLGIWFVLQIGNSLLTAEAGGVAWFAHVGGFVAGALMIRPFRQRI